MRCLVSTFCFRKLPLTAALVVAISGGHASTTSNTEPIDSALSRSTASTTTETKPYVAQVKYPNGVTVLFSGSRGGKMEPCGCRSLNLGGIDREAGMVDAIRKANPALLQIDAGGFFREFPDPTMKLETYYLLEALQHLKVDAINIGYWDLRQGISSLKEIATSFSLPLISANIVNTTSKNSVFPAYKEVTVKTSGGQTIKVAIIGVTASNLNTSRQGLSSQTISDPESNIAGALTPAQMAQPAPASVIAHEGLLMRNRWTLPALPLLGQTDASLPASPDLQAGGAAPATATSGGNTPALDFALTTATGNATEPYEVQDEIQAVKPLAEKLRADHDILILLSFAAVPRTKSIIEAVPLFDIAIAGEYVQRAEPENVGPRKTILAATDHDGKYLGQVDLQMEGSKIAATSAELHPVLQSIAQLKEFTVHLDHFRRDTVAMPIPETQKIAQKIYAGASSCRSCHAEAYTQWKSHKHALAMKSLVDKGMQFNPDCLRCHTVAYKQPGGFTDLRVTASLANVQCEVCHGPGQQHSDEMRQIALSVSQGSAATSGTVKLKMEWNEQFCRQCHDPQNDPFFNFTEDLARVRHKNPALPREHKTTVPLNMM